jgi:hypothetical protein
MPANSARTPWHVAIHESGHAFVAWRLGHRVDALLLGSEAGPGRAGVCRHFQRPDLPVDAQAHHTILIHVAGRAADTIIDGSLTERPRTPSDISKSMELARTLTHFERDARHLVVTSYERAREILSVPAHWRAVVALAKELHWRGRLDGDEVNEVIRTALGVKPAGRR